MVPSNPNHSMILLGNFEQKDLVLSWQSSTCISAAPPWAPTCGPSPGSPPLSSGAIRTTVQTQLNLQTQHPEQPLRPGTATFPFPGMPEASTSKRRSQETPSELQVVAVPLVPLTLACPAQEMLLQDQLCTEWVWVLNECSCSHRPSNTSPQSLPRHLRLFACHSLAHRC